MESNIEVLPKLKIEPLNDSAIRLWGIHPKEIKTRSQRDICTLMFIAGLFTMPLLFSRSVMSDCLWPHGLQHTRLPCPSPTTRACPNSCPLSQWCHPTISSSVVPFFFCLLSFPVSGSFPMNWLFTSCGQNTGASASVSVLPMNIQGWFHLGLTGWSPSSSGDSQAFSPAPQLNEDYSAMRKKETCHWQQLGYAWRALCFVK